MQLPRFPWLLLKGKWILEGHEAWARDLLVGYLSLIASRKGQVYVWSSRLYRAEILEKLANLVKRPILNNILFLDKYPKDIPEDVVLTLYIEPLKTPFIKDYRNIIVSTYPRSRVKKYRGWRKAVLRRLEGNDFILYTETGGARLTISVSYIGYANPPTGLYGEALKLLRRGIVDYGSLTTRDALDILCYNLGLKRDEARKVIAYLVSKRFIDIKKGELIVY